MTQLFQVHLCKSEREACKLLHAGNVSSFTFLKDLTFINQNCSMDWILGGNTLNIFYKRRSSRETSTDSKIFSDINLGCLLLLSCEVKESLWMIFGPVRPVRPCQSYSKDLHLAKWPYRGWGTWQMWPVTLCDPLYSLPLLTVTTCDQMWPQYVTGLGFISQAETAFGPHFKF